MADVLFVLIVLAFFGLMVLLVKACDTIIGPDEAVPLTETADSTGTGDTVGSTSPQEVAS